MRRHTSCSCGPCTCRNPDPGARLIRAIHQAEDANRGRPGYRSGVTATGGAGKRLLPSNRTEAA